MGLAQILEQLPSLTFEQRQILIRRALELDDLPLSEADETVVESRLSAHYVDPNSSVPLQEMKMRLRSRPKS